jgi:hypothetical protein
MKNQIADEYWVTLRENKRHPTWPGVLLALHENGLLGIEVQVLQYPAKENGEMAVCQATVTMPGVDGRELVYTEIGDASPRSVGPQIAPHLLRMAATRAKGRAGRDALALGIALAEELYESEEAPARLSEIPPRGQSMPRQAPRARHDPEDHAAKRGGGGRPTGAALPDRCEWPGCRAPVSGQQARISREWCGHGLCEAHEAELRTSREKKAARLAAIEANKKIEAAAEAEKAGEEVLLIAADLAREAAEDLAAAEMAEQSVN